MYRAVFYCWYDRIRSVFLPGTALCRTIHCMYLWSLVGWLPVAFDLHVPMESGGLVACSI